jgi:hypothetical protein
MTILEGGDIYKVIQCSRWTIQQRACTTPARQQLLSCATATGTEKDSSLSQHAAAGTGSKNPLKAVTLSTAVEAKCCHTLSKVDRTPARMQTMSFASH